jgi:hypothetical protein
MLGKRAAMLQGKNKKTFTRSERIKKLHFCLSNVKKSEGRTKLIEQ